LLVDDRPERAEVVTVATEVMEVVVMMSIVTTAMVVAVVVVIVVVTVVVVIVVMMVERGRFRALAFLFLGLDPLLS
jgi:hypothetical protein